MRKGKRVLTVILSVILLYALLGAGFSVKPVPGEEPGTLDLIYAEVQKIYTYLSVTIKTELDEIATSVAAIDYSSDFSTVSGKVDEVRTAISSVDTELDGIVTSITALGATHTDILADIAAMDYSSNFLAVTNQIGDVGTAVSDVDIELDGISNGISALGTKIDLLAGVNPIEPDEDGIPDPSRTITGIINPVPMAEIFVMRIELYDYSGAPITNLEAMDFEISMGEILSVRYDMGGTYFLDTRFDTVGQFELMIYVNRVLVTANLFIDIVDHLAPDPLKCLVEQVLPYEMLPEIDPLSNLFVLRADIKNFVGQPIAGLTPSDFVLSQGEILHVQAFNFENEWNYSNAHYLITGKFDRPGHYDLQLFVKQVMVHNHIVVECPDLSLPSAFDSQILFDPYLNPVPTGAPFEFGVRIVNDFGDPIDNLQPKDFKLSKGEILTVKHLALDPSDYENLGLYAIEARLYELGQHEIFVYADYVKLNTQLNVTIIEEPLNDPTMP